MFTETSRGHLKLTITLQVLPVRMGRVKLLLRSVPLGHLSVSQGAVAMAGDVSLTPHLCYRFLCAHRQLSTPATGEKRLPATDAYQHFSHAALKSERVGACS